jgi:hypothetical protein
VKVSFKKSIEYSMDSNDEEEHEDPKEESKYYLEHSSEEPDQPLEHVELVVVPKNRKQPTLLESTLQ